jgi:hypothetical protein
LSFLDWYQTAHRSPTAGLGEIAVGLFQCPMTRDLPSIDCNDSIRAWGTPSSGERWIPIYVVRLRRNGMFIKREYPLNSKPWS